MGIGLLLSVADTLPRGEGGVRGLKKVCVSLRTIFFMWVVGWVGRGWPGHPRPPLPSGSLSNSLVGMWMWCDGLASRTGGTGVEAGGIWKGNCAMVLKARRHFCRCQCWRPWQAHSPCVCAVCSTRTPWRALSLQALTATNQRPIGNSNHHSRSKLVVPQSGSCVTKFSVGF